MLPLTEPMLAFGLMVIGLKAETVPPQPPVIVNIIFADPALFAVTTPLFASTDAMEPLLLLQEPVPPLNTILLAAYVAVAPMHKSPVPETDPIEDVGITVRVNEGEVSTQGPGPVTCTE